MSGATGSRVGLLGTGLMGTAMAHRLLNQGVAVIAWDRQPDHVQPLAERGAEVASTAGEVVSGAQAVITMLPTAEVVLAVVEPLLVEWPEETIWLQMSSVGAAEADRLVKVATAHGMTLFDAPVSGSTHPAAEGQLTILASVPDAARGQVGPVFRRIWLERPVGGGGRYGVAPEAGDQSLDDRDGGRTRRNDAPMPFDGT